MRGFDDIVLALGTVANNPLEKTANALCSEVYVIGDAKKAGKVYTATHDAMDVALRL